MTIKEQIDQERMGEDTVPSMYHISKSAEETVRFFARQMDLNEDEALDILLRYLSITDNCLKVLEDLDYTFDPKKVF